MTIDDFVGANSLGDYLRKSALSEALRYARLQYSNLNHTNQADSGNFEPLLTRDFEAGQ